MSRGLGFAHGNYFYESMKPPLLVSSFNFNVSSNFYPILNLEMVPILRLNITTHIKSESVRKSAAAAAAVGGVPLPPLDLTEDNVRQVLADARIEFGQLFDTSVGMTGQAELAELDGPFVKIRLKGRFWHKRSTVVARLGNYLKQRIPEILEVDIEDEKQLDDSPENF